LPPESADTVPAETVLPAELTDALASDLYTHQAGAIERLKDGENVSVATSTSSGKTWVYTLYYALLKQQNPDARGLFLYPTRALSADQEQAVNDLFDELGVDATAETYDGDTPTDRRPLVRDRADVVISNFAGINAYLDSHVKWHDIYSNCELLVIDESHTYTGIHGMHVSWVIRRLRRILEYYGVAPPNSARESRRRRSTADCPWRPRRGR
jgi:DEAD/DEAH box helicase domain-containing protein